MSWLGAVVEGVGLIADASQKAKAGKQQRQQLEQARNYATTGPLAGYTKAGAEATDQTNELLGLRGSSTGSGTQGAQTAFDKYLDSSGYKFNLSQGQAALDASSAAKGLTGSGSAIKGAVSFGEGLGGSYFDKYLAQLGGVANRGLSSATAQTNAYGGLSTAIGNSDVNSANEVGNDLVKGAQDTADYLGFSDKSMDGKSGTSTAGSDLSNTNGIFGNSGTTGNTSAIPTSGKTGVNTSLNGLF